MLSYRATVPANSSIDVFQGTNGAGTWDITVYAEETGVSLSLDGTTAGFRLLRSNTANGFEPLKLRVTDQPLYLLAGSTAVAVNVVVTKVAPTTITTCG